MINSFERYLLGLMPKFVTEIKKVNNELFIFVESKYISEILEILSLHTNFLYTSLVDISSVDYPERVNRFEIVYHLLSYKKNHRVNVKTYTDEITPISSVSLVYPSSVWSEREIWDMHGIFFINNPDLRRILTDYGFEGHPLRKDFPLTGYNEVRYDDTQGYVVSENLELAQEFRLYDYTSPWEYRK